MRKILRFTAAALLTAVLAGCGAMEYKSSGGEAGEPHPGHVGHEKH